MAERQVDVDGRCWRVTEVIEGLGWDQEMPMRRENWLLLESAGERRYIAPLPADWAFWPDDKLRAEVAAARPSKRRPLRG